MRIFKAAYFIFRSWKQHSRRRVALQKQIGVRKCGLNEGSEYGFAASRALQDWCPGGIKKINLLKVLAPRNALLVSLMPKSRDINSTVRANDTLPPYRWNSGRLNSRLFFRRHKKEAVYCLRAGRLYRNIAGSSSRIKSWDKEREIVLENITCAAPHGGPVS